MGKKGKELRQQKEQRFQEKIKTGQIKYFDKGTYDDLQVINRCMDIKLRPSRKDRERFEEIVKELKPFAEKIVKEDIKENTNEK